MFIPTRPGQLPTWKQARLQISHAEAIPQALRLELAEREHLGAHAGGHRGDAVAVARLGELIELLEVLEQSLADGRALVLILVRQLIVCLVQELLANVLVPLQRERGHILDLAVAGQLVKLRRLAGL